MIKKKHFYFYDNFILKKKESTMNIFPFIPATN